MADVKVRVVPARVWRHAVETRCLSRRPAEVRDLLGERTTVLHGSGNELAQLSRDGFRLCLTPRSDLFRCFADFFALGVAGA